MSENTSNGNKALTAYQRKALAVLAEGGSIADAAGAVAVLRSTQTAS